MDNTFLGGKISSWMIFVFFITFACLHLFGMILYVLTRKRSKEDLFRRNAFLLSGIRFAINGFWIMFGSIAFSY
jgi:hypothetical protein